MSLLYESIQAVIAGGMLANGPQSDELAVLCVNKLRTFLEENDQNCIFLSIPSNVSEIRRTPRPG
jgi:AP-3 complex subunit delta